MQKDVKSTPAIRKHKRFVTICLSIIIVSLAVIVFSVYGIADILNSKSSDNKDVTESHISSSEIQASKPVTKIASATVVNTGDILIHNPVLWSAEKGGSYDFSPIFKPLSSYFDAADYAVANLELSLGGPQSGKYQGYPAFNIPDELVDGLKSSNIDMLLTANNHCYDTGAFGLTRTVQVLKEKQIDYTGTRETSNEPRYLIKDVNGIKIGMICYTYSVFSEAQRIEINGAPIKKEAENLVNTFAYNKLESFYADMQNMLKSMKKDGAECTAVYLHWGDEYRLKPNENQKAIAQKLCNMGVDIIIGGHPHVIEPLQLLHAEGGEHQTVCLYSMGNAVSNQRKEEMKGLSETGHTEDGMLFYYTFDKYSDGKVVLSGVDVIPTWVNKTGGQWKGASYSVYALENENFAADKLGLDASAAKKAKDSYIRTKELLAESLTECQTALGCEIRFK